MRVKIGSFDLMDGTAAGGISSSGWRQTVKRGLSKAEPVAEDYIFTGDEGIRETTISFQVARLHASIDAAELYCLDHDAAIPSGTFAIPITIKFTTFQPDGTPLYRYLLGGNVESHQLVLPLGITTVHSYTITGGQITATEP